MAAGTTLALTRGVMSARRAGRGAGLRKRRSLSRFREQTCQRDVLAFGIGEREAYTTDTQCRHKWRLKMANDTAVWANIDTDTLSVEQQAAYAVYKVAQREAARLREAFEASVTESMDIPAGQRMVFGYRFGKLGAGIGGEDRKP